MTELNKRAKQFMDALLHIDAGRCSMLLDNLSSQGGDLRLVEDVVIPALEQIGLSWEDGDISLSQVYMAGRICERVVGTLLLENTCSISGRPRVAIGVIEDYHALGKRMVISALRSSGYDLLDYGHGLKADDLVERALKDQLDILLISCLMLTSAVRVKDVVAGLRRAGSRAVVVVGGAPFRLAPMLWREVGAHYMGTNSGEAVRIVRTLMEDRIWE